MRKIRLLLKFLAFTVVLPFILAFALCVLGQDFLLFPQLLLDVWDDHPRDPATLPGNVESIMMDTADGERVELWRAVPTDDASRVGTALFLHGNGGRIENFYPYMRWLTDRGYLTYGIEYRGYGASSGWPSASGIISDLDQAVKLITDREGIDPKGITPFGISIGTGFAVYAAQKYSTDALVLAAPYSSLKSIVRSRPGLRHLVSMMWNDVPAETYISNLKDTCVVAAHGVGDGTILFQESEILRKAYRGSGTYALIVGEGSGHNDIFWDKQKEIETALRSCQAQNAKPVTK